MYNHIISKLSAMHQEEKLNVYSGKIRLRRDNKMFNINDYISVFFSTA